MRAVVVTRAGPLIGPYLPAAGASVEIQKPCHVGLLSLRTKQGEWDKGYSNVIASAAKQSICLQHMKMHGLLRRFAPRNDG
jgi:hypothetical protein